MIIELYALQLCDNEVCTTQRHLTVDSPEVIREDGVLIVNELWYCAECTKKLIPLEVTR